MLHHLLVEGVTAMADGLMEEAVAGRGGGDDGDGGGRGGSGGMPMMRMMRMIEVEEDVEVSAWTP
jgi:hypothetical protein